MKNYDSAEAPFFMKNKEWYYYDEKEGRCYLTDIAPQEAIDSFNEFYSDEDKYILDENGIDIWEREE